MISTPSANSEADFDIPLDIEPGYEALEAGQGVHASDAFFDSGALNSLSRTDLDLPPDEEYYYHEPVHKVLEWSGEFDELPSIAESDATTGGEDKIIDTKRNVSRILSKRRSSETHAQTLQTGRAAGMRRISSMSEMLRLKGRLRVPAFLSTKASPASPAVTACSVHIFEPPKLKTGSFHSLHHGWSTYNLLPSLRVSHRI